MVEPDLAPDENVALESEWMSILEQVSPDHDQAVGSPAAPGPDHDQAVGSPAAPGPDRDQEPSGEGEGEREDLENRSTDEYRVVDPGSVPARPGDATGEPGQDRDEGPQEHEDQGTARTLLQAQEGTGSPSPSDAKSDTAREQDKADQGRAATQPLDLPREEITGPQQIPCGEAEGSPGSVTFQMGTKAADSVTGPHMRSTVATARTLPLRAGTKDEILTDSCRHCGASMASSQMVCPTCNQDQGEDKLLGTVVEERYKLMHRVGEGAMGVVYEVRHLRLGKRFAMKVIHKALTQVPEFVGRFEREALSCSRLDHPNCISGMDFGHLDTGELYLVMEFVEGKPLSSLMQGGKALPIGKALEITRQVLLGLQHAHQAGIVHRDIKPDNVMLVNQEDEELKVKILDFGIAKAHIGNPSDSTNGRPLTRAGAVFGTPQYMAPEQVLGTDVDARADLYAVGTVLWQMLTGRRVFEGDGSMDVLGIKLAMSAPPLSDVAPGVFSWRLQRFLSRALERKPKDRFASADEMLEALAQIENEPGRGLITPGFTTLVPGLLTRAAAVPHHVVDSFSSWYHGQGPPAHPPTWGQRMQSLFTTVQGLTVLLVALGLTVLVAILPSLVTGALKRPLRGDPPVTRSRSQTPKKKAPRKSPTEQLKDRLKVARMFLAQGSCRESSVDLKNIIRDHPREALAHYLLGAALVCRRHYTEALGAYRQAIILDPGYRADARIMEDLERMLKVPRVRLDALEFMGSDIGPGALTVLVRTASQDKTTQLRHRAVELVTILKAEDRIDRAASYSLDLVQASNCQERKEIIARLRALGDPEALPALRRIRDERVGIIRKRYRHLCVRKEAIDAIIHILWVQKRKGR